MEDRLESLEEGYAKDKIKLRVQTVLLYSEGKTPKEISDIVGVHPDTVCIWIKKYDAGGIDGLIFKTTKGLKLTRSRLSYTKTPTIFTATISKAQSKKLEEFYLQGVDYSK